MSFTIALLRDYCLAKPGTTESMPFGADTLVFKVMEKIFALAGPDGQPLSFNVKCDPGLALEFRERHGCVQPGYHMNKKHWNTVLADGSVPDRVLLHWVGHSYALVAASLPLGQRRLLAGPG